MSEPRLAFHNPVFRAGRNITVRLGLKWADHILRDGHRKVVILGKEGQIVGYGKVTQAYVMPLNAVPNEWLADFHDGTVTNRAELAEYMCKVYGEAKLADRRQTIGDQDAPVTVIAFTYTQKAQDHNG